MSCFNEVKKYKHHIIPKHRGGNNNGENLVEVSYTQHCMFHFCEWQRLGLASDFKAWKMLKGEESFIAGWNKGQHCKEETKNKISKSKKGVSVKNSGQTSWTNRPRAKQGEVINTKTGEKYTGVISDIARQLGLNCTNLLAVASGHRNIHKGYIARYTITL
jgi:hypothetical protein